MIGRVTSLQVTDARSGQSATLKLPTALTPPMEAGKPLKLVLSAALSSSLHADEISSLLHSSAAHGSLSQCSDGGAAATSHVGSDSVGMSVGAESGGSLAHNHLLSLKYLHEESGNYVVRKFLLSLSPLSSKPASGDVAGGIVFESETHVRGGETEDRSGSGGMRSGGKLRIIKSVDLMTLQNLGKENIETNVKSFAAVRASFVWKDFHYLFRVFHDDVHTFVPILEVMLVNARSTLSSLLHSFLNFSPLCPHSRLLPKFSLSICKHKHTQAHL